MTAARSPFAVLTPYPIPPALRGKKVPNLGDGFILRAIERRCGRTDPARLFSPRVPLPPGAEAVLAAAPAVLLAGANQLHDAWTLWPGLTAERLRASGLRPVPFGVGLHGEPGHNERMAEPVRALLRAVHERIAFSSWRCPHTVDYLRRELPELAPQLLMTGCPVLYDRPLLDGEPFRRAARHVAVTVTERGDFWARETALLDAVAALHPRARRTLVLHQVWSAPSRWELLRHRVWPAPAGQLDPYQRLRQYAVRRGYRVLVPRDLDAGLAFYGTVDRHYGSRLHAHLLCLSLARPSWLVPVDGRAAGIAAAFDFPLCDPTALALHQDFDFERVRARARAVFPVMQQFLASLPQHAPACDTAVPPR